jgi:hypothetical protein
MNMSIIMRTSTDIRMVKRRIMLTSTAENITIIWLA